MSDLSKSEGYLTLCKRGSDRFEEKRSQFIGYAIPIITESEALDFIEEIRKKHSDATHNVYAYTLRKNNICRYSDDGEPQGTAALPVLDVLKKGEICDACIVVTRYFGGTLLGAGGLVRAYSKAAKIAVDDAGVGRMQPLVRFYILAEYSDLGKIERECEAYSARIINTEYADKIKITLSIPQKRYEDFCLRIVDISAGKLNAVFEDVYHSIL
ncbi:MAG: YigZ family protein [Clostridia bacterium]|nr:YigZ family protein [Clostridia bacterium]